MDRKEIMEAIKTMAAKDYHCKCLWQSIRGMNESCRNEFLDNVQGKNFNSVVELAHFLGV